ncbi:family 78 glycoside hydrolase catalytic domain [Flavisolibacter sp. BT320]|nr:family 78 glycoside hydrolase catalytic domain [Flavisolibacter longurius]
MVLFAAPRVFSSSIRELFSYRFFFCFLSLFFSIVAFAVPPLQPARLFCEYRENPLGLAEEKPRFTWTLASAERNQQQAAYEIQVSDNLSQLLQGKGDVWQSGKVPSSQNILIDYEGEPLRSFTRYFWRVKVYNGTGEASAWSKPAWFETAMLKKEDWKAAWIGDGSKQFAKDEDFYGDDPAPLFRKTFPVRRKLASARLYVSGLGYFEGFLNGKKIGDHVLDPGWTTYGKQVLYVTHDITPLLKRGTNTVGFMLGNGWYNPLPLRLFGRFNLREVQQTGRPCVKAQLHLRYTDGTEDWIVTDESWQTAPGPVIRNNVYLGEHYDARKEFPGWTTTANLQAWKGAVIVDGPSGNLAPQRQPPIRVKDIIKPKAITEVGKDSFIVDLGENFAGVGRIRVKGPAGTRVALRYGEDIHADGRLNYLTTTAGQIKEIWKLSGGRGAPKTTWQEDVYYLKGDGLEEWSPRFTFHGFRYIEISGWPGKPTVNDIEGLRMHSDLQPAGEFSCSNDMFNQTQEVIQRTFLSNVFSVQSDCPAREKMGYGADIVVTAEAFLYNYDMANFYRKTVIDFANEQRPEGGITELAPYTGIADRGYGDDSGPLGWQLVFPFVQKKLYEFYGDKRILSQYYPAFQKQLEFLKEKEVAGLFHWDISDHEALDPRPEAFTASAFYYHHVKLGAEIATILGNCDDSAIYTNWANRIKNAVVRKYHVPNTGRFDNATQAAQLFALWYGLAPEEEKTMAFLEGEIQRHNGHLSTGIFATKFLFDVAREKDQNELAYAIANKRDFPGWGHMLENGATTLWESWEKPDTVTSMNHPMFGSVSEWFYRSLLGINAAAPGFAKITIKPQPVADLSWAKGTYHSIQGPIVSEWKKEGGQFFLSVTIPANTTADVWIPAKEGQKIRESNKSLEEQGLAVFRYEKEYAVLSVPSGTYHFTRHE